MAQFGQANFSCSKQVALTDVEALDSLDGIPAGPLGALGFIRTATTAWVRNSSPPFGYVYDEASFAVHDGITVVRPRDRTALEPGRWLLSSSGGGGINALLPIATGLTCEGTDFVTTQAAGDVELSPASLTQTFAALAGDVFLADIQVRARGSGVTPANGVRFRAKMDGAVQSPCNGIDAETTTASENVGVNGLLVAPAAGNVEIQAFVEVVSPPATPAAEVTVAESVLRVVQLRPVALSGATATTPTSASRLLSAEPQVIASGVTAALTWAGGEINVVTTVPGEAVLVTFSINRANANPPGAGGIYRVRLDGASVGLSPNDDGDWASAFSYTQRITIPAAGVHTIGVNVTCSAGVGDSESVFQSTLVGQGANVS